MSAKLAVLLVNLGTPSAPSLSAVRAYLREFLSDPRVVDLPGPLRWVLVHALILPFRAQKSAHAYQAIWTPQGSPLRFYSQALAENLQASLGEGVEVILAMRYGQPALKKILPRLASYDQVIILPLFPQYASATTGSILEMISREMASWQTYPKLMLINDFYDHPAFIEAWAQRIEAAGPVEHVVLSYHSLPLRQLPASRRYCYRSQCYQTSQALAARVGWTSEDYSVAFQSKLGGAAWLEPELLTQLKHLADRGLKEIAVACPSFVTDCLETLEEVGLRASALWQQWTGGHLKLLPCLNEEAAWVKNLLAPYLKA